MSKRGETLAGFLAAKLDTTSGQGRRIALATLLEAAGIPQDGETT